MSYYGSWKIDDLLTFYANTTRFDTGNATDADSPPAYRIYEDETGTAILTGSMALLDSSNTAGFYSEQITLSAANGFEKGKSYAIYIAATVNSVAGATHHTLQIEAEVDANRINWANVDNPSTAVNLSATNIDVDQVVASVSGAVGSVTGNVGGNVVGSVASVTARVTANVDQLGGVAQSLTDLKDFADDGYDPSTNKVQGVVLTDTVTTYTGNTPQTGDSFARLGAPAGASVSADIAAIEAQTDDIGTAGAGLTAVPWNAAWDAEVQSEVQDAIEANNLDHVAGTATGIPAIPAGTYIDQMMDDGTAVYDRTTDSLQALRDNVGTNGAALSLAKTTNITGFNDLSAAQVNAEVVDALNVDTYAEIGQESPAATQTIRKMIAYLYKAFRNKKTQTSTTLSLFADDGTTVDQKSTISDDGTTYTHSEIATGP